MAKYCDSARLELNWFRWLVATAVPTLEPYRQLGLLWTKVPVESGPADPRTPLRHHCLALNTPYYFSSQGGEVSGEAIRCWWGLEQVAPLPPVEQLRAGEFEQQWELPFLQQGVIVPGLRAAGYYLEPPAQRSWHAMVADVRLICSGVACRFNPPSEEEKENLTNEVLTQVMEKMHRRKLVYTPGLAPVFNLLTTTIHRCLYSIMNRDSRRRRHTARLREELRYGAIPHGYRSLRVPGLPIRAR